ncbi:MFS transporter, partial [bacterium]|nr:MFS transporter [bacterium]
VWGVVVCSVIHLVALFFLPLTERERSERCVRGPVRRHYDWSIFFSRPFLVFALVAFLGRFGMMAYYGFFTLYVENELGFAHAGYIWALGPLSEIPLIFFSSLIIARIGVKHMLGLAILATAIRLAGFALAPSVGWIVPLQFLHAFTFGAYHAASMHYIQRIVPPDMKQSMTAVFAAFFLGLPAILGSALGGNIIVVFGYRWMYGIYALIAALALVLHYVFVQEPRSYGVPEEMSAGVGG